MLEFFTTTLGLIIAFGGIFAGAVIGFFYIAGLIKKNKDADGDKLVGILKETVDALEEKVDNQKKDHDEMVTELTGKVDTLTEKVEHLEKENETLRGVLQGRDDATQEFYKKALEAFNKIEVMNSAMEVLTRALTEHFKTPTVSITNQAPKQ